MLNIKKYITNMLPYDLNLNSISLNDRADFLLQKCNQFNSKVLKVTYTKILTISILLATSVYFSLSTTDISLFYKLLTSFLVFWYSGKFLYKYFNQQNLKIINSYFEKFHLGKNYKIKQTINVDDYISILTSDIRKSIGNSDNEFNFKIFEIDSYLKSKSNQSDFSIKFNNYLNNNDRKNLNYLNNKFYNKFELMVENDKLYPMIFYITDYVKLNHKYLPLNFNSNFIFLKRKIENAKKIEEVQEYIKNIEEIYGEVTNKDSYLCLLVNLNKKAHEYSMMKSVFYQINRKLLKLNNDYSISPEIRNFADLHYLNDEIEKKFNKLN